MSERKNNFSIDLSPFQTEILTEIPMEKLVSIICKLYWNLGHEEIYLETTNSYFYYFPERKIESSENIKKIRVSTRKGINRQKFDCVCFYFERITDKKIKIRQHLSFGFRNWQLIYIFIALLISIDYLLKPFTTALSSMFVFFLLLIPLYIIINFRIRRVAKDPNVAKCKKEFEEYIREKEEEFFF